MSTTDRTSTLPPSRPRVLTADEADQIADSIRPSWEAPPPSPHLTAPMAVVAPVAGVGSGAGAIETAVRNAARGAADRTLTNSELRALERSKRLRAVPESSYREERSPSAPPARVEKGGTEPSIIVDPRALAAPRLPTNTRAAAPPRAAPLSADSTVVIAPSDAPKIRRNSTGVLVGFGAVAALVAGGLYFASTQASPPATDGPGAQQLSPPPPATTPATPPATTPAAPTQPAPVEAVVSQPPTEAAPEPAAKPAPPPQAAPQSPRTEVTRSPAPPRRAKPAGGTPKHDPVAAAPPQPKQPAKPSPTGGGDKGKLVRDLPF
jgi:hypothetical protein